MCTRFVYNGIDKIVGFNFDIDLSVWDHTVITEENRFYIGIKMPYGMYHSFHGINKNGNVGTLLYVHGNENARYIESEDCITISELTEKFIKAEISFDKALDIVKKKKDIPSEELLKSEDCSKNHVEELGVRLTIEQAVRKLPEEIRETAVLYFFQELKQREIAELLHIKLSLVKYRIGRAKELLMKELEVKNYDEI